MKYAMNILSGVAGIILALIGPASVNAFRGISTEKATGLGVVASSFIEVLFSPMFWALAFLFSGLFWAASHLGNKPLRVLLFWIPTLLVSTIGFALCALFGYAYFRLSHR